MKKAVVIMAQGFEEAETSTITDILRRANIQCDIAGFDQVVEGAHQIKIKSDFIFDKNVKDYDMIILPGGYEGTQNMANNSLLLEVLKDMNQQGKYICAMCAAPVVLEKAGLLKNRNFTAYQGYDQKIKQGIFKEDSVVVDGNLITSRGPATAYAFAYKLVDVLGGDSLAVKNRMVYFNAFNDKGDK